MQITTELHLLGRQGVTLIAAAGVELALWDACAKAAGLPLAELLCGSVGRVRTYNQGLALGDAISRCHGLDDQGLYWLEEPVVFDNYAQSAQLTRELNTPVQIGENIYGPRSFFEAVQAQAADLYPEVSAHLLRATEIPEWLEWRDRGNPIIAQPFEIRDGFVDVPDRPGNGIEWDEDSLERFSY